MRNLGDRANSRLFEAGELQVARFHPDGSGEWLALKPETSVNPFQPSRFQQAGLSCPVERPHSDRRPLGRSLGQGDAFSCVHQRIRIDRRCSELRPEQVVPSSSVLLIACVNRLLFRAICLKIMRLQASFFWSISGVV